MHVFCGSRFAAIVAVLSALMGSALAQIKSEPQRQFGEFYFPTSCTDVAQRRFDVAMKYHRFQGGCVGNYTFALAAMHARCSERVNCDISGGL